MFRLALFAVCCCFSVVVSVALGHCLVAAAPAEQPRPTSRQERLKERDRLWQEPENLNAKGQFAKALADVQPVIAIDRQMITPAQPQLARPSSPKNRQERLDDCARLIKEAEGLRAKGQLAEAVDVVQRALTVQRDVLGPTGPGVARSLELLGSLQQQRADLSAARQAYQDAADIRARLHGAHDWRAVTDQVAIAHIDRLAGLSTDQRQQLGQAYRLAHQAAGFKQQGKTALAIEAGCKAVALFKQVLGEHDLEYIKMLNNLALSYDSAGNYAKALPLFQEAVALCKQVLGEKHPQYAAMLSNLAELYKSMGEYTKAEPLFEAALRCTEQGVGQKHIHYATILNNLAGLYYAMGNYAKAEPLFQHALAIRKQLLGEQDPAYAESLSNLATLYTATGAYAKAEALYQKALEIRKKALGDAHPMYAVTLNNLAEVYKATGEYAKAEPLYRKALAIERVTFGDKHPEYAKTLGNLAALRWLMGDYIQAESLYQQSLAIKKRVVGENHPAYTEGLHNLALLYESMGDDARAETLLRRAADIDKQALGEHHPDYAAILSSLAALYTSMGKYAKAEPLYQKALSIYKASLGENHRDYARALSNLGALYQSMGDFTKAEVLYEKASAIYKQALGDKHPAYASTLNNLASLYRSSRDYAKAKALYEEAAQISKQCLGEQHPEYAANLSNLALLYEYMGDLMKAENLFQQAVRIYKQSLGEKHPSYARSVLNLAALYSRQGRYAAAEPLFRSALSIYKDTLGEQHREYAVALEDFALLYWARGSYLKAESLLRQGLKIDQSCLDLAAAVQGERQQIAAEQTVRGALEGYVGLGLQAGQAAEATYAFVLAAKGTVSERQRGERLERQRPELAAGFTKLRELTTQLARLALAEPGGHGVSADRRQRLEDLTQQKEQLETTLAQQSAEFAKQKQQETLSPDNLRASLPSDVALIDLLACKRLEHSAPGKKWPAFERRLAAFVVRRDAIEQVDLGPSDPIEATITRWRQTYGANTEGTQEDPGSVLRHLLWQPLVEHLRGIKTVLICPDGALGSLPWAALPGNNPGTYLIEDVAIAIVPIPRLIPELIASRQENPGASSLLLVGDVAYHASPGTPVRSRAPGVPPPIERLGRLHSWEHLPGTAAEIQAVGNIFHEEYPRGRIDRLVKEQATSEAFCREAPHDEYLHVASHGYFAPAELRSELAPASRSGAVPPSDLFANRDVSVFNPGLLSGLVFAGADQPQPENSGILTALQVSYLDLSKVDLATLSACQTGLGQAAGTEGLLGLQRAFQVAGARSVLATLWAIDDQAARALMSEFYKNLWEKHLPKAEALRQAQIAMLRGGANPLHQQPGRGLEPVQQAGGSNGRLPTYYWAAFVLSGDWR